MNMVGVSCSGTSDPLFPKKSLSFANL
jgi:hypothetical protein